MPGGEEMSDAEEEQCWHESVGERSVDSEGGGLLLGVVPFGCGIGRRSRWRVMYVWTGEVQLDGLILVGEVGGVNSGWFMLGGVAAPSGVAGCFGQMRG